jgi:hypothetical protein
MMMKYARHPAPGAGSVKLTQGKNYSLALRRAVDIGDAIFIGHKGMALTD